MIVIPFKCVEWLPTETPVRMRVYVQA